MRGQYDRYRRSRPDYAGDIQPPAMTFDDVLDDGQAKAGAAARAATAGIDPVKAFRQARNVFGGDAVALVRDA